jgi:hypothetical protein
MMHRVICGVVLSIAPFFVPAGALLRVLTGVVLKVIDGDTIDVQLDGRLVRVR